jgi:type IV pilus assembly protein PilV
MPLTSLPTQQRGSMLLESLIAILLFSVGILAIVGLQAAAIKNSNDAKYRADAALLANQLIAQMWVADRTQLSANYSSSITGAAVNGVATITAGPLYTVWKDKVIAALPGVTNTIPPLVNITAITGGVSVTVTLKWKLPSESATVAAHQFTTIAHIV